MAEEAKSPLASKTIIANLAMGIALIGTWIFGAEVGDWARDFVTEIGPAIMVVVNIILRFITNRPVSIR